MTLKERFKQWLDTNPNVIFRDTQCEKIADDYAIEFSEWISKQGYKEYSNGWARLWDKGVYTIQELLEIFKKEKGL
jgi:hypothetical protein